MMMVAGILLLCSSQMTWINGQLPANTGFGRLLSSAIHNLSGGSVTLDVELLTELDYDADGLPTLLGLYDGVPLTERDDSWSMVLPDRILVFKGPLERWCSTREELVEEIEVTVIHEIAHHFGIDDDRLHELGWE